MKDVIDRVAAEAGISTEQADGAIRIILNFLYTDGPSAKVAELADRLGAADYLSAAPAKAGLLGRIGGMFGAGGAMAAFSALSAEGLDLSQIQGVTGSIVGIARETVGGEAVDEIVASIPGLDKFA
jgi:hypothetical protein